MSSRRYTNGKCNNDRRGRAYSEQLAKSTNRSGKQYIERFMHRGKILSTYLIMEKKKEERRALAARPMI